MILLVQSQDSREYLWKPWLWYFKKSEWDTKPVIITEKKKLNFVDSFQSGKQASFGKTLKDVLKSFKDEYVWYTLDDYFITGKIDWKLYEKLVVEKKADAIRVQPGVVYESLPYRFIREDGLLRQTEQSWYQISFQTSIWRREFLIDCLYNADPWVLENSSKIKRWNHKIYFVPELPRWYIDVVRRGKLLDRGKKLIDDIN